MLNLEDKNKSSDRILVLETIDGNAPKNSIGNTDNRLFTGGNQLHAIMDPQTCFWRLKYEKGILPGAFQDTFTSFNLLKRHVDNYFKTRNIRVKEVID